MGKSGTIERLADLVSSISYDDLTPESVHYAKRFLIDSLACALGGFAHTPAVIAKEFISELGGTQEATIYPTGEKTTAIFAAFVNGISMRTLDFNDIYWIGNVIHPSEFCIPQALSLAEKKKLGGKDVILGVILGYDIQMRLAEACTPLLQNGWAPNSTLGQFTVPFVAAKMLGLNKEKMTHAVNISGIKPTLGQVFYGKLSMSKSVINPITSQVGVTAAFLAEKGFTGPEELFEGERGFLKKVNVTVDEDILFNGFGKDYRIIDCAIKSYPCHFSGHSAISALLDIVKENDIQPENVDAINVKTFELARKMVGTKDKYLFDTKESAQFSLPYCLAAATIRKRITLDEFDAKSYTDPAMIALSKKVVVETDKELDRLYPEESPAQVEVIMKSGKTFKNRVDSPKGSRNNPLSDEELMEKVQVISKMSKEQNERFVRDIWNLENIDNIGDLIDSLTF